MNDGLGESGGGAISVPALRVRPATVVLTLMYQAPANATLGGSRSHPQGSRHGDSEQKGRDVLLIIPSTRLFASTRSSRVNFSLSWRPESVTE